MKNIKTITTINSAGAIYLRNNIRKALDLDSGDKVSLEVVDGALIIKPFFDIVEWAITYLALYEPEFSMPYKVGRDRTAGITTVILPEGEVGVAQCSPNDKFNDNVGEAIALARALGAYDEIPKEIFGEEKGRRNSPFLFWKK